MSLTLMILILLAVALAVGGAVVVYVQPLANLDVRRLYLYIVAFVALLVSFVAALALTGDLLTLALRTYQPEMSMPVPPEIVPYQPPADAWVKGRIADFLGPLLVALPIWLLHWRRALQLTGASRAYTIHRVYLYAIALIAVVTAIGFGGLLVAQGFRGLLGLIDLSNDLAQRNLYHDLALGLLNGLICLGLWWGHWRETRRWGDAETGR